MTTEALKSTSITNLDATPVVPNTSGEQAAGRLMCSNDYVASTAGVTVGSTYKICRIPTNAKIKQVLLTNAAHGGSAAFDISIGYSDSATDGTLASNQGNIVQISSADNKLFGAAVACSSAANHKDITFQNTFVSSYKNVPLWQALINAGTTDFTADPGGFFDFVLKSTATDTSGGNLEIQVYWVMGN